MASSKRLYRDGIGNMFIPMDVDGSSWNEHFINTTKLITIAIILFTGVIIIFWLNSIHASISGYLIILGLYLFIVQFIVRYIVLEERYYYKVYNRLKDSEISNPSVFWNIISIKEELGGSLLVYGDGKVGAILKLDRDTIIGKDENFIEIHYDSLSDFYKELSDKGYSFVQMNLMEKAGKNPRIDSLNDFIGKSDNENINKLMEMQVGYIKSISRKTLYESDYILIYTKDLNRTDYLINDIIDIVCKLMNGAYISFSILNTRDIVELVKQLYGIKYFDVNEAMINISKNYGSFSIEPFKLNSIVFKDGSVKDIDERANILINKWLRESEIGNINIKDIDIKKEIGLSSEDNEVGIDFDSLGEGFGKGSRGLRDRFKMVEKGSEENRGIKKGRIFGMRKRYADKKNQVYEEEKNQLFNKNRSNINKEIYNDEDIIDF